MDNCAKCGKELGWLDRIKIWNTNQLKNGYIRIVGKGRIDCPEYTNKKLCVSCVHGLFHPKQMSPQLKGVYLEELNSQAPAPTNLQNPLPMKMKDSEYQSCINGLGLLEGEEVKLHFVVFRQYISQPIGVFTTTTRMEQKKGLLVFTNDNMIFMQQEGAWSSKYSQALRIPLENITGLFSEGTLIKHLKISVGNMGFLQQEQFLPFVGQGNIDEIRLSIERLLREVRQEKKRLAQEAMSKGTVPAMIFCKYCGTRNKADQSRCANCAAVLS